MIFEQHNLMHVIIETTMYSSLKDTWLLAPKDLSQFETISG